MLSRLALRAARLRSSRSTSHLALARDCGGAVNARPKAVATAEAPACIPRPGASPPFSFSARVNPLANAWWGSDCLSARYSQDAAGSNNGGAEAPVGEGAGGQAAGQGEATPAEASAEEPVLGGAAEVPKDPKDEEIAALKERVLRAYADMENLMVRMKRENDAAKQYAIQSFAKALLDVADNLQRASSVASAVFKDDAEEAVDAYKQHLKSLLEGVQATERQLLKAFKSHGLEKVNPAGEAFDPNQHEAMFEVVDAEKEPGIVLHVMKEGYVLNGRVLRAAEVGVTKRPES